MARKIQILIIAAAAAVLFFFIARSRPGPEDGDDLVIWHWMTDRHEVFQELARRYETQTGIPVRFELNAPSSLFTIKVRAAAATKTLPDIFGVLGGTRDLANFAQSGLIHRLDPYLEESGGAWKKRFYKNALEMTAFSQDNPWDAPPGYYGIPIDVTNLQMIANVDIFRKAGIETPPETWEEFIAAGETVRDKTDSSFFVAGFSEVWIVNSIVRNMAFNLMGRDRYIKTLEGSVPFDAPEWIEVFSRFREMADKNLLASGIVSLDNNRSERLFTTNRAAVTYNGSWCVNVYRRMNPDLRYRPMFFPRISEEHPVVIMGGAGSSFVLSEHSAKIRKAVDFLKWLTSKEIQEFLALETSNLPANKSATDSVPEMMDAFSDDMGATIHPYLLPVAEDPELEEALARGIQSIIIGETAPRSLARQLVRRQERMQETS
jgi:ABC-type glycerol-3-phosphate transport system substrate-binding protein